jgi:hypothetical protein
MSEISKPGKCGNTWPGSNPNQRDAVPRRLYGQTAVAITIAGKLHRGEALRVDQRIDERKWLRAGAEAARLLAEELARLVEQMEAGS